MYIKNKTGSNIEPWGTPALILAQGERWLLRITLLSFFKKSVKRINKFPEIPLRLRL